MEEKHALECVQVASDEDEEWGKGREGVREWLSEGIEKRWMRAREENDGDRTFRRLVLFSLFPLLTTLVH